MPDICPKCRICPTHRPTRIMELEIWSQADLDRAPSRGGYSLLDDVNASKQKWAYSYTLADIVGCDFGGGQYRPIWKAGSRHQQQVSLDVTLSKCIPPPLRHSVRSWPLDLWPLTLNTFSAMFTHITNICAFCGKLRLIEISLHHLEEDIRWSSTLPKFV